MPSPLFLEVFLCPPFSGFSAFASFPRFFCLPFFCTLESPPGPGPKPNLVSRVSPAPCHDPEFRPPGFPGFFRNHFRLPRFRSCPGAVLVRRQTCRLPIFSAVLFSSLVRVPRFFFGTLERYPFFPPSQGYFDAPSPPFRYCLFLGDYFIILSSFPRVFREFQTRRRCGPGSGRLLL